MLISVDSIYRYHDVPSKVLQQLLLLALRRAILLIYSPDPYCVISQASLARTVLHEKNAGVK